MDQQKRHASEPRREEEKSEKPLPRRKVVEHIDVDDFLVDVQEEHETGKARMARMVMRFLRGG